MRTPRTRDAHPYATEGAARFDTTLALRAPTRVVVNAEGPLDYPQARQRAQATLLLVPGHSLRGDGLVLTLHGFIVEDLAADGGETEDDDGGAPQGYATGKTVLIRARVRMLCGCPTTPGGLWDSGHIQVQAYLRGFDGTVVQKTSLGYAGTASTYEGRLALPEDEGRYELEVLATDVEKVNFGRTSWPIRLE